MQWKIITYVFIHYTYVFYFYYFSLKLAANAATATTWQSTTTKIKWLTKQLSHSLINHWEVINYSWDKWQVASGIFGTNVFCAFNARCGNSARNDKWVMRILCKTWFIYIHTHVCLHIHICTPYLENTWGLNSEK